MSGRANMISLNHKYERRGEGIGEGGGGDNGGRGRGGGVGEFSKKL